jgi:hypothetical protein
MVDSYLYNFIIFILIHLTIYFIYINGLLTRKDFHFSFFNKLIMVYS